MKDWIIRKLAILTLEPRKKGYDYFYTDNTPDRSEECYAWIDAAKSVKSNSTDPLKQEKIDEGWYPVRIWHHVANSTYYTHWIFERPLPPRQPSGTGL